MSRTGKIARLPLPIREQINHRLQNGDNGRDILAWLNSTAEVKTVLADRFDGREITDSNLSDWRLGGYRDWEDQQAALAEARRIVSDGQQLADTANDSLADAMATWIIGRYTIATRKLMECQDDEKSWKLLRELSHDVVALRRGEHSAEWLRLEQERIKLLQRKHRAEQKKAKSEKNPPLPAMTEEEKDAAWDQIFGVLPPSVPNVPSVPSSPPATHEPPISSPPPTPETELQQVIAFAEKGDAHSEYSLGSYYRDGFRVPKDLEKARHWLSLAASHGLGAAKLALHALLMRWQLESAPTPDSPNPQENAA